MINESLKEDDRLNLLDQQDNDDDDEDDDDDDDEIFNAIPRKVNSAKGRNRSSSNGTAAIRMSNLNHGIDIYIIASTSI